MAKRIIGLPKEWQEYLVCILLHMVLPLLPLGLEALKTQAVKGESLTLAASMYAISIGISSQSKLSFALAIFVSLGFTGVYGIQVGDKESSSVIYAALAIFMIFIVHACERYNRHVVDRAPFWEF
jgi:hypothetical protein